MRKRAQRDQGTCPGHTGGIKAGNQDREAGLSICVLHSGASHSREQWYGAGRGPASPGNQETAEKRSYMKWESPKKEDPVVRSCPLGQEWPQGRHEDRVV